MSLEALTEELQEEVGAAPKPIVIPYKPRTYFRAFHESQKRHRYEVVHRRGGKTVAIANDLIVQAIRNQRPYPPPRYGYVGPSFSQAKDTIWAYLKHYTAPIPGMKVSESDLQVTFPHGAIIALYPGADAYERMRGLYFDGAALDEFALLNPDCWPSVVRPCLADYRGRAIIAGTSNGDDHFHERKIKAEQNPEEWDVFDIKISDTVGESLHPDEVAEMRHDMGDDRFNREMMNDFSTPVEGAYYGELMLKAQEEGRICKVPFDPRSQVITWWDIGVRDLNTIWFIQRVGREYHAIDYIQGTKKGLPYYAEKLAERKIYNYKTHVFPPDIKVQEWGSGRTRIEIARELQLDVSQCHTFQPLDGIEAVRSVLPSFVFDEEKCASGISALKAFRQAKNGKPLHDWASHASWAFAHGALMLDLTLNSSWSNSPAIGRLRRRIRGLAHG